MALSLNSALAILKDHGLLRELIGPEGWTLSAQGPSADQDFTSITYDSRQVGPGALLCCKGHFQARFMDGLDQAGLAAYLAEEDFSQRTQAPGLIVSNVRQAMSLLAAEFYGRPQELLKLVGITGTKGKTTTAYYVQALLSQASGGRAALLSSVDNCLDGRTYTESELTTPESLDLFRMMRQAADAGMRYMVMEVSSQAYKVDRVHGLTFDVGAFLNISSDHISPVEHPTFEDYLYCKRQIAYNSRLLVLGADHAYEGLVKEDAAKAGIPITTFALDAGTGPSGTDPGQAATWVAQVDRRNPGVNAFQALRQGHPAGSFTLAMDGLFNGANAAAALAIVDALGVPMSESDLQTLSQVRISGRMERLSAPGIVAYVDYAHNYASTSAVLDFVHDKYGGQPLSITLVTGSAGGKAVDRRKEIVDAAQYRVDRLILTEEDTELASEPAESICQQMMDNVTNPQLDASIIQDRGEAIAEAVRGAQSHPERLDAILVIGKGEERWIKRQGKHVPYEGDDHVLARLLKSGDPQTQQEKASE
ncbi:UDP-N-acetylmuramoylalanyl-D-glutamate--2,6- diaminopimelate ligase [Bifidobacterium actinocoloniiforme DSM 22766]|uniref:UDP-N-acetylmuramoylalanyl-D-glutamate--2,6-diaminopimelate ligase n=1 Tax=Bifidobacterium actinocoloniiforme DSM 22766 TaxID=1437605 RepID=A0A086Z0Z1_9BIFI|nr:UDP-N-acetylmuramoyl-L-alanyl-D-glutamate--2,6-diaminopimelate ligase [Bifidobacterium actinocoloniiforme]AKV55374.1 UDP-N-acetylmuramoylalanyl-D-glutamate--2,6-diaminopimelate ligase [Bifidobacterium actinocoloniiforme DSM 22766]KFI40191.1 UDP-N-acetylmuramoylalanyl-D-glutamate--2,6- diaminopimelate ligase [Bifidobacterium actinocoloniiforme DSM 22766]